MKNLLSSCRRGHFSTILRPALITSLGSASAFLFCVAIVPGLNGKEVTPAEMIQSKLPKTKTLGDATKSEVLSAVCAAVTSWPNEAPQIVRTAAGARKEISSDIIDKSIRCLRPDPKDGTLNCDLVGQTVAAGISADPDKASNIIDVATQLAPACRDAIESAGTPAEGPVGNGPSNLNPPPGSLGGGADADPLKKTVTICDNGQNVQISGPKTQGYLGSHPGSRLGACQATPGINR
jgi:hypothetical protein